MAGREESAPTWLSVLEDGGTHPTECGHCRNQNATRPSFILHALGRGGGDTMKFLISGRVASDSARGTVSTKLLACIFGVSLNKTTGTFLDLLIIVGTRADSIET